MTLRNARSVSIKRRSVAVPAVWDVFVSALTCQSSGQNRERPSLMLGC